MSNQPKRAAARWCALAPLALALLAGANRALAQRSYVDLDPDWRFSRGDFADAMMPGFDDSAWRELNVPHDWSSEGPFGPQFASGNGYAPGGVGWYRKHFQLDPSWSNRLARVEFDGVYDNAEVWFNGQFVGGRPYGYSSFQCDVTPMLRFGTNDNVLAVRVDHSRFADSRWYTGSGIYRPVRLRLTRKLRVRHWGIFVTTPRVSQDSAIVRIETTVANSSAQRRAFRLQWEILDATGKPAGRAVRRVSLAPGAAQTLAGQIKIARPQLWSPDSPTLYNLKTRLIADGSALDQTTTSFGVRSIRFDPDRGFFLNGAPLKLKGVCLHGDAGCLGTAVPEKVWERRLRSLKQIGANAIRTSHNPPAPAFLDLCDRLGFLVMDEAFDEFTPGKNKWITGRNDGRPSHFGYAEWFDQWSVTDVRDMVRRDRNHPSVIIWSIGNEIDYPNDPFSNPALGDDYRPQHPPAQKMVACARPLVAAVKKADPTRPVTMALANVAMSDAVGLPALLDIVGYNYQEQRYPEDHRTFPRRVIFGSETSHSLAAWLAVRDNPFVAGQFLWTGIDYLGEARAWPNRASGSGLLDLCGFKKPLGWYRQSLWSRRPFVYLCASDAGGWRRGLRQSWNWPSNALVRVRCFTTCPEVSLLLNGRSLGSRRLADAMQGALSWEVPFEPGELRAIGRGNGSDCMFVLKTAGPDRRIELTPDATQLRADGTDICHLRFQIVDANGIRVPNASPEVTFSIRGPADLLGIENGDLDDPETGKGSSRHAFHGRGLAIVESSRLPGKIVVRASAPGLSSAVVQLNSR